MTVIYAKHEPYEDGHLGDVIAEMQLAGTPTLRCVEWRDGYYALEGSHRLAAAFILALPVKVVLLEPDAGEGLERFWDRVAPDLPSYNFMNVTGLRLDAFLA